LLKWGFRPDPTEKGLAPINARVETAAQKYLFRDAWKQRRCVVPADGWYEWKALPTGKQPYYFTRTDDRPLFFAGLWTGPTFCLFTTAADGALNEVHDRKPLSLEPAHALAWIREGCATDELISRAIPAGAIRFHPVSKAVSNWRNDGAHLIEINSL
jgi:putative SOS response-associated peptidase YedK